jgi:hypothetical protein
MSGFPASSIADTLNDPRVRRVPVMAPPEHPAPVA